MGSRIKRINIVFALLLLVGLLGSIFQAYQIFKIERINHALQAGELITDDSYPYQKKFSAAYQLGVAKDYKHAIQTYSQILETPIPLGEQAKIQFNIGNNLLLSGLNRWNLDGKMNDEIRYDFAQAKLAYEQALRLDPASRLAKFNLSLLLSILPQSVKNGEKEQSAMELSNLPIGLP